MQLFWRFLWRLGPVMCTPGICCFNSSSSVVSRGCSHSSNSTLEHEDQINYVDRRVYLCSNAVTQSPLGLISKFLIISNNHWDSCHSINIDKHIYMCIHTWPRSLTDILDLLSISALISFPSQLTASYHFWRSVIAIVMELSFNVSCMSKTWYHTFVPSILTSTRVYYIRAFIRT